ncbi:AAA family ATPase [Xenorhabdus sp. Flor]|uniref:ATP-dependent nuclease n=1 Tax=Xenorhabdus cabanillasii TaxID=351673 RepID=UPI0019916F07|nr:AAA family ATPase [Xenorhabdus sp. Flor]MBD2816505.1 AAA family ATPase [Xenorhabdus sp. Flor]
MVITKLIVEGFKGFKDRFCIEFNESVNIIVGDNEAGKSTILEAINLGLTGLYAGKPVKNNISQYLFNDQLVRDYLASLATAAKLPPPSLFVELHFKKTPDTVFLEGDGNCLKSSSVGVVFKIKFNEDYKAAYEALLKAGDIRTLPIEYYDIEWKGFNRESLLSRNIPLKSAFIDSSSSRGNNGSDVYISRIIKDLLTDDEVISVSQSHRKMKESFITDKSIETINQKIISASKITSKKVTISVELSSQKAWESSLITCLDDVPFNYIGKGEQSIVKTNLALSHNKAKESNVILIEEPENNLSHTKLNLLIKTIKDNCAGKQIIITTHSSFVANKLGLSDLIFLSNRKTTKLASLTLGTKEFFEKIAGYDTLRMILCKKAILVEGDSDELVVQRAYMDANGGRLPVEDGIEVISVGISFLRFLEIAAIIDKPTRVVTDNDGDIVALQRKYDAYLGENKKAHIDICFDPIVDTGMLTAGSKKYNYNTLEPKLLKANNLANLNTILGQTHASDDELRLFMRANKTECALKIFNFKNTVALSIHYPQYILDAIK